MRRVLASRTRRRALRALGVRGARHFTRFLTSVVPQAVRELQEIEGRARSIGDPEFRAQALSSIRTKAYHVAGGCIYAAFLPEHEAAHFIRTIVPLESLYDYLDNLCDRHPGVPAGAYAVLHEALTDALDPSRDMRDYFRNGPMPDDGGYLRELAVRTRAALASFPDIAALGPFLREAAGHYTSLQTYKHLPAGARVPALQDLHAANAGGFGELRWWEFAAAAGSQFHVYALLYAALQKRPVVPVQIYDAYFARMSALHVLLDDFIDQREDAAHGELNFVRCYADSAEMEARFAFLYESAFDALGRLEDPQSHRTVLRIMTLFYLTHPKVFAQGFDAQAKRLLNAFSSAG